MATLCQRVVHGQAHGAFNASLIGNVVDPALNCTQAGRRGNITH